MDYIYEVKVIRSKPTKSITMYRDTVQFDSCFKALKYFFKLKRRLPFKVVLTCTRKCEGQK